MSQDLIAFYRKKMRRMGRWMFPRYMRNRDIPFEQTYFIMFGQEPYSV